MPKKYLPYNPNQLLLLPPNLNDWLNENHLARFISQVVDSLDLSNIINHYESETRGAPPYDPVMMVKIRMYADCVGTPSSRAIEKAMVENVPFRFLGAGNFPDFRTISDFRKIHHESLAELFNQVLSLCQHAGLVKMETTATDGVKIKASASLDKSYPEETLDKKIEKHKEMAKKIIEDGIQLDEHEDRVFGPENSGWKMPKDALERYHRAKEELEKIKQKEMDEYKRKLEERDQKENESGMKVSGRKLKHPKDKKRKTRDGKVKEPKANITDPDSRIMKTRKGFIQGYNGQIMVDVNTQIIIAADLVQDQNDTQQFAPMMDQAIQNTGKIPTNATADAGYDNDEQLKQFEDDIILHVPTMKGWKQRKAMREQPPPRGRIPKHLSSRERRERRLLTKKGKGIYKKRGSSVEPVIGQITSARRLGNLLLRGIVKGKSEWKMYCTGHNLLKLWRHSVNGSVC